jgi:shikimate dehydrogenase
MTPEIEQIPVKPEVLKKNMVVMDIVYSPMKTRLLKAAEDSGCITIGGIWMFVYQGARQFEIWTGIEAPVEVMKEAVLEALGSMR